MRKAVVALLFAFGLALVAWVFITQSVVVLQRLANVSQVKGDVTVVAKGQTAALQPKENQKIKEGDVVRTGADGSVLLTWVDGTKVQVTPGSQLEVRKLPTKDRDVSLFNLKGGEVWARVSKRLRRDSRFDVEMPNAVAGVRGTVFSVAVKPGGPARISILEGAVTLQTGNNEIVFVSGQVLDIQPHGGAVGNTTMSSAEREQWMQRKDFLGPLLSVTSPRDGETVAVGMVKVRGFAEPGAVVLVNGEKAGMNRLGFFSADVPISAGENTVEVKATDRFTFSTVISRRVVGSNGGRGS
jgi:hypothetical protein